MESVLGEKCDGNRNLLHACVSTCFPTSSQEPEPDVSSILEPVPAATKASSDPFLSSFSWPGGAGLDDASDELLAGIPPPVSKSPSLGPSPSMPSLSLFSDTTNTASSIQDTRKNVSLVVLKTICECPLFSGQQLRTLLSAKDSNGQTPFMSAVTGRAYKAALILLDVIQRVARADSLDTEGLQRAINSMIFPVGSNSDDSPLHVLCYNDTCSFTWTGALHINQDIFECRTCGLIGSLCCCTECARVCHKGHDCKLKQTSPTAYCDCWEKCKCKAVKAGHQAARFELLTRLIADTDLVNYANGRGENLLLFLLQTVRRQVKEQKQWADARTSSSRKSSSALKEESATMAGMTGSEVPDHDLEPPKFSRKALAYLLEDWRAVRAMILTGYRDSPSSNNSSPSSYDDAAFMQHQGHTAHLDKFTFCLLVKLASQDEGSRSGSKHKGNSGMGVGDDDTRRIVSEALLTTLVSTLVRELKNSDVTGRREEALKVGRRLMASVVRIFVVLNVETAPQSSNASHAAPKKKLPSTHPISKCIKVRYFIFSSQL